MKHRYVLAGFLVGALGLAFSVLPREQRTRVSGTLPEPTERARAAPAKAAGEIAERPLAVQAPAKPPAVAPSAVAPPTPEQRRAAALARPYQLDAEDAERPEALDQERMELATRWSAQTADPAFRTSVVDRMQSLLTERNIGRDALREVDCRTTLCRLVLHSPATNQGAVETLAYAARDLGDETWMMPTMTRDGGYDIEIFVAREGYRLSGGGGAIVESAPPG